MGRNDTETDVIVIGGGPSGCTAAITAAESGSDVILLEKRNEIGGNGAVSTGLFCLANTQFQRDRGIDDSASSLVQDMRAEVQRLRDQQQWGLHFDDDLANLYAKETVDAYDWMTDQGFDFERLFPRPGKHSSERLHQLDPDEMRTVFQQVLSSHGVDLRLGTPAVRLQKDELNSITGVVCETSTDLEPIHAKRGVVVASGGYQANPEMLNRYVSDSLASAPAEGYYLGLREAGEGDGHRMLFDVGARMVNMHVVEEIIAVSSVFAEHAIAVLSSTGKRFHDETIPYRKRAQAIRDHVGASDQAYYVFDDVTAKQFQRALEIMPHETATSDSIEGLADAIGTDPAALREQIEEWNQIVEEQPEADPQYGSVNIPSHGITTSPYHAIPITLVPMVTIGGASTDAEMRPLDNFGDPIEGLYAIGQANGSLLASWGLGGIYLGTGVVFGRIAGRAIVQ